MAAAPSPAPSPAPTSAPSAPGRGAPRALWGVAGGIGLLLLVGIGAVWLATRPSPTPPTSAPVVQSLAYQDLNGALLSVDATSGVTRTLLPRGPFQTRLLDVSPDSLSVAYIDTDRPITATVWYTPVVETLRVRGRGGAIRTVRLPTPGLLLDAAAFVDDDTLALLAGRGRSDLRQLFLYSLESGTTRLISRGVDRFFPLPDQAMLLYTHELTGSGLRDPGGNPRVVELAALEVGGALTPQPLAQWSVRQAGEAAAVWPDPAHQRVYYTRLDTPPTMDQAWNNPWYPVTLMTLPVRPLSTPQPVATLTSEFLNGAVQWSETGRYLIWSKARPTVGPSTPTGIRQLTPVPQGLGEIRWVAGQPSLAELPVPAPNRPLSFVAGGDLVNYLDADPPGRDFGGVIVVNGGTTVPDRATIAAANRTPTPIPPAGGSTQIYDPATGQRTELTVAFNTGWDKAGPLVQTELALALDDRLLVIGPDPTGDPPADGTPAPTHLLLVQRSGSGWQTRSLGAVGTPTRTEPIVFEFFGLTPDHTAVILSRPSAARTLPAAPGLDRATLIYRVPLAGGPWTLLGQALPARPVVPHKPNE